MNIHTIFESRLPRRPYCSNELSQGLLIRPAIDAMEHRYIQPNAPLSVAWLVFDLDYPGAAFAWEHANLPPPTMTVINPQNAHAHLFYGLETPVVTSEAARDAPIRYAAALQAAFLAKLRADPGYAGLIAKNPYHDNWRSIWVHHLYDLNELAEWVDLPKHNAQRETLGLGRNCTMFDELRAWAYQWVREYKRNEATVSEWHRAVFAQAENLNVFDIPLPNNEVKATAKSVAKWTWQHFNESRFSAIQSARGKRGGRPATTTLSGKPWVSMGVSRATYYRRMKNDLMV
ncbi:replication initiation protein [Acidihalobacter prosperus]|uniref:replication initiation protein n=1 Tax=Acidihalobacter prosperus TaxID=160660 RepID=UPI0009EF5BE7|nr:replication initiation protein [Acidihalobacter prosperus]